MASTKKRRKEAKLARPQQPTAGEFRHRDGDRRHRGGPTADKAIADKRAINQLSPLLSDAERVTE